MAPILPHFWSPRRHGPILYRVPEVQNRCVVAMGRYWKTETEIKLHILKSGEETQCAKGSLLTEARIKECPEYKKMGTSIWILYQQVVDPMAMHSRIRKWHNVD